MNTQNRPSFFAETARIWFCGWLAVCFSITSQAIASEIMFSEITTTANLTGDLTFTDVSIDGTLLNLGTGDSTGINQAGNYSGTTWGRQDGSFGAVNTTASGNMDGLNSNILEGRSTTPDLRWTVNSGSGDSGGGGAGSLAPNTTYDVFLHYLTNNDSSQNWGGEVSTDSAFTSFDVFDSGTGTLITDLGNDLVDYRLIALSETVTTDAFGNAELFIRRPQSFSSARTMVDGAIFQAESVPEPASIILWSIIGLTLTSVAAYRARWRKSSIAGRR